MKNSKTQINKLLNGSPKQILNSTKDYSKYPQATSHIGHAGSSISLVVNTWKKVISENLEGMNISINSESIALTRYQSESGKTVTYSGIISNDLFKSFCDVSLGESHPPTIKICQNTVTIRNGANYMTEICPSFINII